MLEFKQIESFFPEELRHFKRNLLREYLQYKILEAVFTSRYGQKLNFMGGTAIHIIHGLPRFSEDLDFDNRGLKRNDFTALIRVVAKKLSLEGYAVETRASFRGAFSADIKISGLLFKEGFSGHRDEKILIKLDTEPQHFKYSPERVIINKFDVFVAIKAVPADILLAQKLFAILSRRRAIGRDFYDAVFLSGKIKPNFQYLSRKAGIKNMKMLKSALLKRCAGLDFKLLSRDIEQFLFFTEEAKKVGLFIDYVRSW